MAVNRPELLTVTCVDDFDAWYWLKTELAVFCRAKGLKVSVNKADLAHVGLDEIAGPYCKTNGAIVLGFSENELCPHCGEGDVVSFL